MGVMRDLRKVMGISQTEVARILGVSQPAVSKMERTDNITIAEFIKVAQSRGGKLTIELETHRIAG